MPFIFVNYFSIEKYVSIAPIATMNYHGSTIALKVHFQSVKIHNIILGAFFILSAVFGLYNFYYSEKILPHVFVSAVDVGSMSREAAAERLRERFQSFFERGIVLVIEGNEEIIDPTNIDLSLPFDAIADNAWSLGRGGPWYERLLQRIVAPFYTRVLLTDINFSEEKLDSELKVLEVAYKIPPKDIRYDIIGAEVHILYDTKPGKFLDYKKSKDVILAHVKNLDTSPIYLNVDIDMPKADPAFADRAKYEAEKIIVNPLLLVYGDQEFSISREKIGSLIVSKYDGVRLAADFDERLLSEYVAELAGKIDVVTQNPRVIRENGRVSEFIAPRQGRTLLQGDTVKLVKEALFARLQDGKIANNEIALPVFVKRPKSEGTAAELGIRELIGKAATSFAGSPQNRIHNIKNGVKFLTGVLVAPGEVFSTVGTLGEIDNAAGYLPELVIKGDETIPEFGGGLCQVSTTLFRSVMNAGLPIVQRRNHSYRVPYYERDAGGDFIGPGLDATIYSPQPDFKFKNDTKEHILIQGYVEGDKAIFELYGTADGRKSFIDGPHIIEETPPGEPVYIESNELPKGETKKIDTAHKGGSAVATYKIEYADGTVAEKEFKSFYRPWSDKWLVGTATSTTP